MAGSHRPSFHFRCPECYVGLKAPVDKVGARYTCPSCEANIVVPDVPKTESSSPEPRREDLYATRDEAASSLEANYIGVVCPVCRTRMHATEQQIGQTMTCPDCDTPVPVVRPAKTREKEKFKPVEFDGATEYAIRDDAIRDDAIRDGHGQPFGESRPQEPVEIPVVCPLCHTRMHVDKNQVGKKIVCPDCETSVVVRPPPKPKPKLQPEPVEQYGVGRPAKPIYPKLIRFFEDRSEPPEEAEDDDTWEFTLPSRPKGPLFSWMVNFLGHEGAWHRAVWLSLGLIVVLVPVAWGINLGFQSGAGPLQQFAGMVLLGAAAITGLIWLVLASGIFLAVVEDTADGAEYVASWPEATEIWSGAIFFIASALGTSMLPGVLAAQLVPGAGHLKWILVPAGLFLAFPFLLLSMMERGSPVNPISEAIFQSAFTKWWAWLLFYFQVAILGPVFGGLVWLCETYLWPWSIVLLAPATVLALMVYFRLIGRLGWHASGERVLRETDQFDRPDRIEQSKNQPAAQKPKQEQPIKPKQRSVPGRPDQSQNKAAPKQPGQPPDPKPPETKPPETKPPEEPKGRGALDFDQW